MAAIERCVDTVAGLLLLDLYAAEVVVQGPGNLSLRKVWTGFEPNDHRRRPLRGYYVVHTRKRRVYAHRFGLTELTAARRYLRVLAFDLGHTPSSTGS